MNKVLLITYIKNHDASAQLDGVASFLARVNQVSADVQVASCTIQSLVFEVKDGACTVLYEGKDLATQYDTILLRNFHRFTDYANALRLYANATGMTLINEEDVRFPYVGKVSQGFLFAYNGIPTPNLTSSMSNATLGDYLTASKTQYPLIVKHNDGVKGLYNYLVKSDVELAEVLAQEKVGFLAQPFIQNNGELRVLTFPNIEPLVFSKKSSGETHLNNTAQGGKSELVAVHDVAEDILQTAKRIQKITGRQLGGIDVLLAADGTWYVLEVNHTPALASGMFTDNKATSLATSLATLRKEQK